MQEKMQEVTIDMNKGHHKKLSITKDARLSKRESNTSSF